MKLFRDSHPTENQAFLAGLELAADGVLVLDSSLRVLAANSLARELMRLPTQTLEGVEFWDLLSDETSRVHKRVGERGLKALRLYTLVEHDTVEGRSIEYRITQTAQGPVVNVRDVTDKQRLAASVREAERRSKALFESNPNAMWVFDIATTQVLAANRSAQRFYGYRLTEFLGLHVADLYPGGDQVEMDGDLPAHLVSRPYDETELCLHRTKDGAAVLVEVARQPLEWEGSSAAVLMTVSDVTTRQLANDELRDRNDQLQAELDRIGQQLEHALREHQTFNAALSQDMQAPLHIVDGFAKTLMTRYAQVLDAQGMHYLRRIQASIERMARMIDDMSYLSRVPRLGLNPQPLDLAPICRSLVDQLHKREPERSFDLDLQPGLVVLGDSALLTRALKALIDNAWKFTSRNPQAWVRIAAAPAGTTGDSVIVVSDNGAGFDMAYVDKLFTPFERLHSSADFPGTGLGLAIVQAICRRHGGSVRAESTEGAGASFYLSLPRTPPAEPTPDGTRELTLT